MRLFIRLLKLAVVLFIASTVLVVLYYRWRPVVYTPLMPIRYVQHLVKGEVQPIHHEWIPLDSMSRHMPVAVIASEDQNFLHHHGFDFDAIRQAVEERQSRGRVRGASTISQQTAKNVFLWPGSTWVRKGFEAYFTVLIELLWPKERIMEVYLNSIEMGPGIYGLQAAARLHFGCNAGQLRRSDCALIAATLPNPNRYSSVRPSSYMRKRQKQILRQMKHLPPFPMTAR